MPDSFLSDITRSPPLIGGPLFAVLFWWLTTALGYRFLRLLRVPLSAFNVWELGLVSAAIGTGTIQVIPLTLGAIGHLGSLEISLVLAALAVVLAPDLWRIARRLVVEVSQLPVRQEASPSGVTWWALFLVFLGVWLVHAVTFGEMGDDDGIHLAGPRRWLHTGTLGYLPTYSLTNATLGFDMVYLVAMAVWSPIGAKILHYSAGVFALFAVVLCARRMANVAAGMLAISLLLVVTPMTDLPILFGNAMIDLAACWMTMTSVLIWLVWRERPDGKLVICMALCAGFAASFKLTSVQVAIAWIPILMVEAWSRGVTWRAVAGRVIVFGLVAMVPVIPWLVRNALLTGNPLYPMLSTWIPTRDWSPELAAVFGRFIKYYSWGVAAGSRLGEIQRKELVLLTAALVCLGGVTTALLIRNSIARSLIAFATVFTLISVALTGLIFRYWMPAIMCAAMVAGVLCAERWSRRLLVPAASLLLVIALAIQIHRGFPFHRPVGFLGDLRMATGVSTFEGEHTNEPMVDVWKYIDSTTPRDARVLLAAFYTTFGASSYAGFWIDRTCYTTDSHLQGYFPLGDWAAFRESVGRAGVTYVVLSDQQFNAGRFGFSFLAGRNEYPFARRLVEQYGEKVYQAAHIQVFRLQPAAKMVANQ